MFDGRFARRRNTGEILSLIHISYGNPIWTQQGAITLAYVGVAEEMKRYEPARWRDAAKYRPDVAELKRDAPEPPKETFSESPKTIDDGQRKVQFLSLIHI